MPKLKPRAAALGEMSDAAHETLIFGSPILGGERCGEAELRAAWMAHRRALMAELDRPGMRPWGYFRYDLGIDPAPSGWGESARTLERLNLMDRAEEIRLEAERPILWAESGSLHENFFGSQWGKGVLRHYAAEFAFASGWHARRGRAELAAKYEHLAQQARAEMSDERNN